jgi:hypothetical protein
LRECAEASASAGDLGEEGCFTFAVKNRKRSHGATADTFRKAGAAMTARMRLCQPAGKRVAQPRQKGSVAPAKNHSDVKSIGPKNLKEKAIRVASGRGTMKRKRKHHRNNRPAYSACSDLAGSVCNQISGLLGCRSARFGLHPSIIDRFPNHTRLSSGFSFFLDGHVVFGFLSRYDFGAVQFHRRPIAAGGVRDVAFKQVLKGSGILYRFQSLGGKCRCIVDQRC